MSASPKSRRINLRATERQEDVLRRAAAERDTSLTDFVLGSAVEHAERVLADRRSFVASDEQFDEFVRLLDHPVDTDKLADLFARRGPFGQPFELKE